MRQIQGFQLIELVLVLALMMLVGGITLPWLAKGTTGIEIDLAAAEVLGALRLARMTAIRLGVKVGVKFREQENGVFTFTMYRDGDGDGVLSKDIESGVDPPVGLPRNLHHFGRRVRLGFPPGPAPRDPGNPSRRLPPDPVRFNRSDLASFGPLGGSTPGSIYLTDGRARLTVVRLFGRTGKAKTMRYDMQSETWR